jgi:hypothetical protein
MDGDMNKLSKSARQKAERLSERKAFGDVTAMSQAMQRAITRQANTSTRANEAHHGQQATADAH